MNPGPSDSKPGLLPLNLRASPTAVAQQCSWPRRAAGKLKSWTVEDLRKRLLALDPMMEQEIEEIRQKYQSKRQPILDAIEAKKRRQQNF